MAKLQAELRQSKGFAYREQEAYLSLQRTADFVSRPIERVFARYKLTPEQYNVMRILRGAGAKGMPTLEIGRRMITRASNVTRIVDRLETKGLVVRKRDGKDRRVVLVRIAAQGSQLLSKMQSTVDAMTKNAMEGLGEQEMTRLTTLLEKLRTSLEIRRLRR